MDAEKVNLEYRTAPICPYCGEGQDDAWELFPADASDGDQTDLHCQACEKKFGVTLHVDIAYSSTEATCKS